MLQVRPATRDDLARLGDLLGQLGYPAQLDDVAARLAKACDDRGGVLVVVDGDQCIGFASYQVVYFFEDGAPRCRITAIAIDEDARGRGAGRAVLAAIEARASADGCTVLEATSAHRPERAAAHRFYPRLGFTDGGEQSTYYVKAIGSESASDFK